MERLRPSAPSVGAGHSGASATGVFVGIQQMEYGGLAALHGAALGPYSGAVLVLSTASAAVLNHCSGAAAVAYFKHWLTLLLCCV